MTRLKYCWIVVGTVALAAGVPAAMGQYQVYQGRVLDASNRLGSGGLNYARQPYSFNAGNRIMTGNVAGGRGFRGFSAIGDPNSLFLGSTEYGTTYGTAYSSTSIPTLPSDQLSAFRRDSFNLSDYRKQSFGLGRGALGFVPYYSPASTVTNTGAILSGRNRVGTSQVLDPYQAPGIGVPVQSRDPFAVSGGLVSPGSSLAVSSRLVRRVTGQPVTGEVNDRLLRSRLFWGAVREVPLTELSIQRERGEALGASVAPVVTGPVDLRVKPFGPEDKRVEASRLLDRRLDPRAETGSVLDRVLERAAADGDWRAGRIRQAPSSSGGLMGDNGSRQALRRARRPAAGPFADAGDVFARMREMRGAVPRTRLTSPATDATASRGPGVSLVHKFGGVQGIGPVGVGGPSTVAPSLRPAAPAPPLAERDLPLAPIQTFVGTHESVVNDSLARAEVELKAGRFYRAAEAYRFARSVAPDNPLPVLGRAMALLAAGDYMTSVSGLFEGIRLFESLSLFQIDLKTFVPDLAVLDRRRADLEARLEFSENTRLRFLLGWAEYCSGLQELGLSNMEKAMEMAAPLEEPREQPVPAGRMDYRTAELRSARLFVQGLRQRTALWKRPVDVTPN